MPTDSTCSPRRLLIISASMGEGHNAAGRALEEAARRHWPGATIRWLDSLDMLGFGIGSLFRRIYISNVKHTPWLYEYYYDSLCRRRWFAESAKWFVGTWFSRALNRAIRAYAPDLIISTFPMATAGLARLRRYGKIDVPVGAWVSDFAPHPFWVYDDIDLNLVMHEVAIAPSRQWVRNARVIVSAPTVTGAFVPGDRMAARRRLDLPEDAFLVLMSGGSLGFGSLESAARALVASSPDVIVVVVCGHNQALRNRLSQSPSGGRLRALGWVDDMASLTVACDVVITNAGGATSLEALACGRAVVMYQPIAAHGRANAELMARAGLVEVCHDPATLTAIVQRWRTEPRRLAAFERRALDYATARVIADGLTELWSAQAAARSPLARRLRPEDALFVHVQTPEVPQQVSAVLVLEAKEDGSQPTLAEAMDLFDAAPGLYGRIVTGSAWRRPYWRADPSIHVADVVTLVDARAPGSPSDLDEAMDRYFSLPLDGTTGTGRAWLVRGLEGGRSAFMFTLHHATADGIAVIGALVGRSRGQRFLVEPATTHDRPRRSVREIRAEAADLSRGLWSLARAGAARPTPVNGPVRGPARHHARVDLPAREVRAAARALGTRTTDLATALVAEALHRVCHTEGSPNSFRVMMPHSTRTTSTFRHGGNHTGAASIDLPIGPMSLVERVKRTGEQTRARMNSAAPHAAHAVVWLLGLLPPWLHAVAARRLYRSTWFNAIASVLPGARSPVDLRGARVSAVYPVLSLAPGVRLAVGVMTWGDLVTMCFTGDNDLAGVLDELAEAVRVAFKELRMSA